MSSISVASPAMDVTEHPLVHDINREHEDSLSATEKICQRIATATGAPLALGLAVLLQAVWIAAGVWSKWDPFPFVFLLTCSNVLQLILIFVLAVGQRQSSSHAELRAEHDHDSISRLLYHQEVQEKLLLAIAARTDANVEEMKAMVEQLSTEEPNP